MRVLVTGAAGMLGRAMLPALARAGHDAVGIDRAEADIADAAAVLREVRRAAPDWVFHLAAFTRVDDCESDPATAHRVNAGGAGNVARAAAACGAGVLAVSTDYVFDGRGTRPYREDDPVGPASVYGASKLAGEAAVRAACPRHVIARTAWLYGEGGPNFVDTIRRRAESGETLRVVGDQRGAPTWTEDLAPALVALAEHGEAGTWHVTNSGECTWYELAERVVALANRAAPLVRIDTAALGRPAPRPAYSVLDLGKFERATGRRMRDWEAAVEEYLDGGARDARTGTD